MLPRVSVITICLDDPIGVARTIESVRNQDYEPLEYVVIDGRSGGETQAVYASNMQVINVFISEPDRGIYDAMNKGLRAATGDWYIMMNAGDVFSSATAVSENMAVIVASGANWGGGGSCIRYPNGSERVFFSNVEDWVFHQQAVFVRRALHERYGYFIVDQSSIAWDYFFFLLIRCEPFARTDRIVSICEGSGVSFSVTPYLHAHAMAFLFGKYGRIKTAAILLLYPVYRRIASVGKLFHKRRASK
jgi:glycosyltransferase involved in cell wall biosynthesis